jgi:Fis family transcriptional regulator
MSRALEELHETLLDIKSALNITDENTKLTYQDALNDLERTWLKKIMEQTKYNQSKAAKLLGMSRSTIRVKLREHFGEEYFRGTE